MTMPSWAEITGGLTDPNKQSDFEWPAWLKSLFGATLPKRGATPGGLPSAFRKPPNYQGYIDWLSKRGESPKAVAGLQKYLETGNTRVIQNTPRWSEWLKENPQEGVPSAFGTQPSTKGTGVSPTLRPGGGLPSESQEEIIRQFETGDERFVSQKLDEQSQSITSYLTRVLGYSPEDLAFMFPDATIDASGNAVLRGMDLQRAKGIMQADVAEKESRYQFQVGQAKEQERIANLYPTQRRGVDIGAGADAGNVRAVAEGMGLDTSWFDAALQKSPSPQADEILFGKLIKQVEDARSVEDAFVSKRLASEFPDLFADYQGWAQKTAEENFSETGVDAGVDTFSGSFAKWAKQQPDVQNQIVKRETQKFMDFPQLYPRYLEYEDLLREKSKPFAEWLQEPAQAAFLELSKPKPAESPTTRAFNPARYSTPRQVR